MKGLNPEDMDRFLEYLKSRQRDKVSEWLGFDIPDEGTEDYDRWKSMLLDIDDIQDIESAETYLDIQGDSLEDYIDDYLEMSGIQSVSSTSVTDDQDVRINVAQTTLEAESEPNDSPEGEIVQTRPSRPVLLVMTGWPGGTMAFKFGHAMQAALKVSDEDISLVQMKPERIFRAETWVTEGEFRQALRQCDVSCPGKVIFIEL